MGKSKSLTKENEEVIALYNFWLALIPWDTPALKPYEAEEREAQPYMIGGKFRSVENFCKVLEWETIRLLQQAKYDIPNAANQSEIFAGLKETQNIRANSFREWEKREALEPERGYGDEAEEHLRITYGELKRRCEEREKRDKFLKECKSAGVEVAVWPGATIEKMVAEKLNVWIDDNIKYLEGMGVQPRRAGTVEAKQADNKPQPTQSEQQGKRDKYTAQICCVVCFLDLYADGAEVGKLPKKTALVEELAANYPQITQQLDSVREEGSHHDRKPPKDMFNELCRLVGKAKGGRIIADWKEAVTARSKHPKKTIKYIENEILIKRE